MASLPHVIAAVGIVVVVAVLTWAAYTIAIAWDERDNDDA